MERSEKKRSQGFQEKHLQKRSQQQLRYLLQWWRRPILNFVLEWGSSIEIELQQKETTRLAKLSAGFLSEQTHWEKVHLNGGPSNYQTFVK